MNEHNFERRLQQLVTLVDIHPHRDELLTIMAEQVANDTEIVAQLG